MNPAIESFIPICARALASMDGAISLQIIFPTLNSLVRDTSDEFLQTSEELNNLLKMLDTDYGEDNWSEAWQEVYNQAVFIREKRKKRVIEASVTVWIEGCNNSTDFGFEVLRVIKHEEPAYIEKMKVLVITKYPEYKDKLQAVLTFS